MKHEGKISISRYSSNQPPYHGISIELIDEKSRVHVVEIVLTPEQFGDAVSGLGHVSCTFELGAVEKVGFMNETKSVAVLLNGKSPYEMSDKEIEELLSKYEIDGWIARESDFKNHHNYNGKEKSVRVVFNRFVEA